MKLFAHIDVILLNAQYTTETWFNRAFWRSKRTSIHTKECIIWGHLVCNKNHRKDYFSLAIINDSINEQTKKSTLVFSAISLMRYVKNFTEECGKHLMGRTQMAPKLDSWLILEYGCTKSVTLFWSWLNVSQHSSFIPHPQQTDASHLVRVSCPHVFMS